MKRLGIPTPEAALAEAVRAKATQSDEEIFVAGPPAPPEHIENLAVAAEKRIDVCAVVELQAEAWDEQAYESEAEEFSRVVTVAMQRAAEAERVMIEKHVAAAQRAAATGRAVAAKRAEVERWREQRRRVATELQAATAMRNELRCARERHMTQLRLVADQLREETQRRVEAVEARQEYEAKWRTVLQELVAAPLTAEGCRGPIFNQISVAINTAGGSRISHYQHEWSGLWWAKRKKNCAGVA